jgi:ATP:ADP antiporter, AAA family
VLKKIFAKALGTFESRAEVQKYTILGLVFGLLIAAYWGLRPIKDSIFTGIVGADYLPSAKISSLFVLIILVSIYSKLVDRIPRHRIFYLLTTIYAIGALILSIMLAHQSYGIPNIVESPTRIIGWVWYIFVESIGTLMVPLFWAFAADVSTKDSARRGFPLIMLCAQFGNVAGPWFLRAKLLGFTNSAPVIAIAGAIMLLLGALIWLFMRVTPKTEFHVVKKSRTKKKPTFYEGLKLLVTQKYLLGIFVFLLAFETIATIVDFYFKVLVKAQFPSELMRSNYLAMFAVITGLVSFFALLFGVSNIQKKLGIRASLITLPILMMAGVTAWWFSPTLLTAGALVVMFKGLNYAINQPSIKQLYIPTSEDTRYKAQAWIEAFGSRGSKAFGSVINNLKLPLSRLYGPAGITMFLSIASVASFALLIFWVFVAFSVSAQYNKAVEEDSLIC